MQQQQLLTIPEAASYFRVHRDTIRRWIRDGRLKAVKPGGRFFRIPISEIQRHTDAATPAA